MRGRRVMERTAVRWAALGALALLALVVSAGAWAMPGAEAKVAQQQPAQSPPATPASVTVTRADGTLTANWDAIAGATSYHVTYSDDGGASWSLAALDHTEASIDIDVDNAKTYVVGVRAKNSAGGSGWRNSDPAAPFTPTTPTPPGPVASVSVTRADGTLTASWDAPSGATSYHVTYTDDGAQSWQLAALDHAATSISIAADNAKTYVVGVRAKNSAGGSAWRNSPAAAPFNPSPTPTPPAAVASVTVTRADGTLTASWDTPDGATSYHVTYTANNGFSWSLAALNHTATSIDIAADNDKTYIVGVRAKNSAGGAQWRNSAPAGPFDAPPAPPAAPAGLTATPGDGSVTLAWDAPDDADAVSGYEYRVRWAGVAWSGWKAIAGAVTSHDVEGLTNGTEYRFKMRALNAAGESAAAPNASPWYVAATPAPPTLTATDPTPTSAVLTMGNWSGDWYYRAESNSAGGQGAGAFGALGEGAGIASVGGGANCVGPIGGSETTVTGLDPDSGYTITAYDGANCGGAEIASATAQTQANLSQDQVSVSNLGQPQNGFCAVGQNNGNGQCATAFTTGGRVGGYTLTSVSGRFDVRTLSPGPIVVAVHEAHPNNPDRPGTLKVTLSGSNPNTVGTYTYTCSDDPNDPNDDDVCNLLPNTTYVVQMSATATDNASTYWLRTTFSDSEVNTPAGSGWSIANVGWSALPFTGSWGVMSASQTGMVSVVATNATVQMSASAETTDGARLTVMSGGQDAKGDWWYKQTEPNDSVCAKAGGSSVNITGLLPGRSYTYAAYDNRQCHPDGRAEDTEDSAIAKATFTTLYGLRADGLTNNSATLVIEGSLVIEEGKGKLKSWWYKRTAPTGDDTCYAVGYAQKSVGVSLTPGQNYTYAAYGDSGCSNQFSAPVSFKTFRLDSAVSFTPKQVTLDIRNWTEAWWYKQTAPTGGPDCTSVVAGTTQAIVDLTSVDYTDNRDQFFVEAYSAAGCGADDKIASTTFFPGSAAKGGVENVTATTATFLAYNTGANSQWGYKSTETGAPCVGPFDGLGGQGVASAPVTGLTPGTTYTFQAYVSAQNNPCSARFDTDVTFTTAPASVSNLGQRQVGSTMPVGWSRNHWMAGAFTTGAGADSFTLERISLLFGGSGIGMPAPEYDLNVRLFHAASLSLSNLGQGSANSFLITKTYPVAQPFTTGSWADGYLLRTVTLDFERVEEQAGAPVVTLREADAANSANPSATVKATLSGSVPARVDLPGGKFAFTCSGDCDLDPNTTYFIHVASANPGSSYFIYLRGRNTSETLKPSGAGWSLGDNIRRYEQSGWVAQAPGALSITATEKGLNITATANPDAALATLSGPARPAENSTGVYTCTGSGCALAPDTTYYVVLSVPVPQCRTFEGVQDCSGTTGRTYYWQRSGTNNETASPADSGFSIANEIRSTHDGGSTWTRLLRAVMFSVEYGHDRAVAHRERRRHDDGDAGAGERGRRERLVREAGLALGGDVLGGHRQRRHPRPHGPAAGQELHLRGLPRFRLHAGGRQRDVRAPVSADGEQRHRHDGDAHDRWAHGPVVVPGRRRPAHRLPGPRRREHVDEDVDGPDPQHDLHLQGVRRGQLPQRQPAGHGERLHHRGELARRERHRHDHGDADADGTHGRLVPEAHRAHARRELRDGRGRLLPRGQQPHHRQDLHLHGVQRQRLLDGAPHRVVHDGGDGEQPERGGGG